MTRCRCKDVENPKEALLTEQASGQAVSGKGREADFVLSKGEGVEWAVTRERWLVGTARPNLSNRSRI